MSVKPGQLLGQYRIIEQIGKGGMATVYRASQPSLSRQVAIKVLPDFFADDASLLVRFRQEATAIGTLRHPNILTVFDSGESNGIPYIVTELIDGGTLASRLGKPLPIDYCIEISKAIASALDYAHSRGMIHRDVKPSNILLTPDGTPILADFGLARMVGSNPVPGVRLTISGAALGTPEYMAPEQVINKDVSPAVDIYALSVILYEMLTGGIPYSADTQLAILMSRATDPLPMPRERNSHISEAVQEVLMKGLAKEPADRYSKASELVRTLEAASRTAPATSTVEPALTAPTKVAESRRKPIVLATVIAVVAVAAAIAMGLRTHPTPSLASKGKTVATAPAPAPPPTETASTSQPPVAPSEPPGKNVPALTPAASKKDAPIAAEGKPDAVRPPRGKLLYSIHTDLPNIAATKQPNPANAIAVKGSSLEFTLKEPTLPLSTNLPLNGIGDFVAVMQIRAISRKPTLNLQFHKPSTTPGAHVVQLPAFLRLSPPAPGARPVGAHSCCQDFDIYTVPIKPDVPMIFTGPQPIMAPAVGSEPLEYVISVKGPLIVVYAGGFEIARVSDSSFGAGGIVLQVQARGPQKDQFPAVLQLDKFEIYESR